jgi:DNA-binding NtrC family response regulator
MSGPPEHDEPSTVVRPGSPPVADAVLAFVVDVVEGPDKGTRFAFDSTRPSAVLVGQSAACDVRLTDRQVSRRHAAIDVTEAGLRLVDLDSTNGTTVNGLRVTEVYLAGGEIVRLGQTAVRIVRALSSAKAEASNARSFGPLIGESPEMRRLYPLCARLAGSDVPVVIEGETGTGKEVLAEALHQASPRAVAPFVVFDCTAVPPALLESALFGHEKGSFTGATSQRRGVFEQAHGGTLFIDEIGELEPTLQPKLLRAIERGEIQRVGASGWLKVDVRIVAANRRDLDREVQAGRFRDDLFFRLAVGRIELPPLRRRRGDVAVLARHFWTAIAGEGRPLPGGLLARLEDYAWPGNVRELQNVVERMVVIGAEPALTAAQLAAVAPHITGGTDRFSLPRDRLATLEEVEAEYIAWMIEQCGGNKTRAAERLGVDPSTLHRRARAKR